VDTGEVQAPVPLVIRAVPKEDTTIRSGRKLVRGSGRKVMIASVLEHTKAVIGGRGAKESKVGRGVRKRLGGEAVEQIGSSGQPLGPVASGKGGLEQQGAHDVVCGANHALSLTFLGRSAEASKLTYCGHIVMGSLCNGLRPNNSFINMSFNLFRFGFQPSYTHRGGNAVSWLLILHLKFLPLVSKRKANRRIFFEGSLIISEGPANNAWVSYIPRPITVGVISESFGLRDVSRDVCLQSGIEDSHIWRFSLNVLYSAQSTYSGLLHGAFGLEYENLGPRSLIMLGSLIFHGLSPWVSFLSPLALGMYLEMYVCSLELRIPIFGDFPQMVCILRNQLTVASFMELLG
jgi:hypothetical protein